MKRYSRVERLARHEERNIIKRIFFLSIVSLVLVILLLTFGINILGKFADFLGAFIGNKNQQQTTSNAIPEPPRLDPLPHATNSARLAVSGYAQDGKVLIFQDDETVGETEAQDGKFKYENVNLKTGENQISAKVVSTGNKESDFAPSQKIIFDKTEPKLEIETPVEGQSFSGDNRIKVSGKTDADSQVYANGFLAAVNSDGHFEVYVPLLEGESTIEIKAQDEAGNEKLEKRKVNFQK